jgi:hypothetical protein
VNGQSISVVSVQIVLYAKYYTNLGIRPALEMGFLSTPEKSPLLVRVPTEDFKFKFQVLVSIMIRQNLLRYT